MSDLALTARNNRWKALACQGGSRRRARAVSYTYQDVVTDLLSIAVFKLA